MNKNERVAFYCRIKNNDKEGKTALISREKSFEEIIKNNAETMDFAGMYIDFGSTNKELRPGLERLLSDCKAGKIDLIITKNMAQLYRNTTELYDFIKKLKKLNPPVKLRFEDMWNMDFEKIVKLMVKTASEQKTEKKKVIAAYARVATNEQ